jgi:hypothetical protein
MRGVLTKALPEDHQSFAERSCIPSNNDERPKHQNMQVLFSSAAFFVDPLFALGGAKHCRSGWRVLSFITSFYGNTGAKFFGQGPSRNYRRHQARL